MPGHNVRWLTAVAFVATLSAIPMRGTSMSGAVAAQDDDVPFPGEDMRPCAPVEEFTATGFHQRITFPNVVWKMKGAPTGLNTAWYRSLGNEVRNLTISIDRRWEWINPESHFQCNEIYFFGPGWLRRWHALETRGEVVPYGPDDEQAPEVRSETVRGGHEGDDDDTPVYYICWYYVYADGTRSEYYHCELLG